MEYRETLTQPLGVLSGRYELGKVLGRGGMSEVREGWDLKLSRPVAIKLLQSGPGDEEGPDTRLRFETEARATAALSSSNIVIVHDVGEHQGLPFIVMERLPGVSLADHIARGPLPQPFVQTVLNSVLAALASAPTPEFCTATSNPATSCSPPPARPSWRISASPRPPVARAP